MKIVILDTKTLGSDIDLSGFDKFGNVIKYETTKPDETFHRVRNCDIVITNKVVLDKDILENSNIKLICITATGMNNVDLETAKNKGIVVKNVAGYSTSSVAQITLSLALKFMQDLEYYIDYSKKGLWSKSDIFTNIDVPFNEIENKNWGIIGLGAIGEKVANIVKAYGGNVSYYSTSGKNLNTNFNQMQLEELLQSSDIISIHCGLNEKTSNLLNKTNLLMLKENAIIVNVGRGGIINEKDLVETFNEKNIRVALDVVEVEPIKEDSVLNEIINSDRMIITPHIAWSSVEARNKLIKLVINNIEEFVL